METLSHRERVIKALNHEQPDRVPLDLAGGTATDINSMAYSRLVKYLGLSDDSVGTKINPRAQTTFPSEEILRRFDIDFRRINLGDPPLLEFLSEDSFKDELGVLWVKPEHGHFVSLARPFQEREPTLADLERFRRRDPRDPRDPRRIKGLREQALKLRQETDYAITLNLPSAITGQCQSLRGFVEWLEDLVSNPALAEAFMEHALMFSAGMAEFVLEEVGDCIDTISFSDDLGFQDRPFMRPVVYCEKIKPYHRRLVEAIKSKTDAKVVMHCCGSIYPLIPDLIDIGVDVLNPVQVSAADMDSRRLKAEFGADLSFWGAIDTQEVLPLGSPEDVRNEVKRRIEDLGAGGGYVLAPVHNIQAEVPPENIVSMFDSAREQG